VRPGALFLQAGRGAARWRCARSCCRSSASRRTCTSSAARSCSSAPVCWATWRTPPPASTGAPMAVFPCHICLHACCAGCLTCIVCQHCTCPCLKAGCAMGYSGALHGVVAHSGIRCLMNHLLAVVQGGAVPAEPLPHGARAADVPEDEALRHSHPGLRPWHAGAASGLTYVVSVVARLIQSHPATGKERGAQEVQQSVL